MAALEPRGNSVHAIVRVPGGTKKSQTFDTKTEAKAWAERMEVKKALGRLSPSRAAGVTVGELFEAYLDAVASKTDSGKWKGLRLMKWCKDPLADKRLADVVTHDINEWISRSLSQASARAEEPVGPTTSDRALNRASGAFGHAVNDRQRIAMYRRHGAPGPERGRPCRHPFLTAQEIRAIRKRATEPVWRICTSTTRSTRRHPKIEVH